MPKRGQTVSHKHVPLTLQAPSDYRSSSNYDWYDSACGESAVLIDPRSETVEEAIRKATCPACAKKWGALELAKYGDRITVEPMTAEELPHRFKSGVKVTVDGVLRGYVVSQKGFGKGWVVYGLSRRFDPGYSKGLGNVIGARLNSSYDYKDVVAGKSADGAPIWAIHRAARDAAIAMFPTLVEQSRLLTVQEQIDKEEAAKVARLADEAERQARREKENREREEQRQQREESRTLAREAVQAISDRADRLGLSNAETMGLLEALKLL